jgi:hypothetical protein
MADLASLSDLVIGKGIGVNPSKSSDLITPLSSYSAASTCDQHSPPKRDQKIPKTKIRLTGKLMNKSRRDDECDMGPVQRAKKFPKGGKIRSIGILMEKSQRVQQVGSDDDVYRDDETAISDEFAQDLEKMVVCLNIHIYDNGLNGKQQRRPGWLTSPSQLHRCNTRYGVAQLVD